MANIYIRTKEYEDIIRAGFNVVEFVHNAVREKLDTPERLETE